VFDNNTSTLWWDHDGVSALTLVAQLSNPAQVTAHDVILV
jgi:hypothetical protein